MRLLVVLALLGCVSGEAESRPLQNNRLRETERLVEQSVDQLIKVPGGIAGYGVVIAAEGSPDFILTRGVANAATRAPVSPDTAFYIASQTKSYTGLLASRLDREGALPLDTTLAQVWPGLRMPGPLDARRVTLRQLLSHSAGFENPVLEERTAYTDEVQAEAYPRLLEAASESTKGGFQYSNTGYLIYSAALKARTGRDWKSWLASDVFAPLGLSQTYSRSSLVAPGKLAWGHQWDGSGWVPVEPKPDAIMHAAGGLFATPRDLAKWIRWQLGLGNGQAAISAGDFKATRIDLTNHAADEGGFGIKCNGYSLGWWLCTYEGAQFIYHGGTYTGVRTHLFFLPAEKVGVALLANSDGMTGNLGQAFMAVIASSLLGKPDTAARAQQMIATYRQNVAKQVASRTKQSAKSEADPKWHGWTWKPGAPDLARYEGVYHSDLYGDLEVRLNGSTLTAALGVMRRELRPAAEGLFGARATPVEQWEAVRFLQSPGGVAAVDFAGKEFVREAH